MSSSTKKISRALLKQMEFTYLRIPYLLVTSKVQVPKKANEMINLKSLKRCLSSEVYMTLSQKTLKLQNTRSSSFIHDTKFWSYFVRRSRPQTLICHNLRRTPFQRLKSILTKIILLNDWCLDE